jgi:hypothetical protein
MKFFANYERFECKHVKNRKSLKALCLQKRMGLRGDGFLSKKDKR